MLARHLLLCKAAVLHVIRVVEEEARLVVLERSGAHKLADFKEGVQEFEMSPPRQLSPIFDDDPGMMSKRPSRWWAGGDAPAQTRRGQQV